MRLVYSKWVKICSKYFFPKAGPLAFLKGSSLNTPDFEGEGKPVLRACRFVFLCILLALWRPGARYWVNLFSKLPSIVPASPSSVTMCTYFACRVFCAIWAVFSDFYVWGPLQLQSYPCWPDPCASWFISTKSREAAPKGRSQAGVD